MARHRHKGSRRLQAARRIEAILDAVRGRGREEFDRRDPERGPRPRKLDVQRDGRLFDRLACLDFEYLLSLDFAADPATLRVLLPQSVLGRAQNGHGFWRDETGTPLAFLDATFDRVLTGLEALDPGLRGPLVRRERNRRLDQLERWLVEHMFDDEMLLEHDEQPLLGIELLRGRRVATRDFLRGFLLAAWMDDLEQRRMCLGLDRRTFTGSELVIGGGKSFVVRPDLLAAVGIVDPGRGEFSADDINRLADIGVLNREDRLYTRPEFEQEYFRMQRGDGVCDDLALIFIGARHGLDAFLGAFVVDAVDTYDKFLWHFQPGGMDGRIAATIQARWRERYGEPLVSGEEILAVIRAAAKLNDPPSPLSSSHRRFIQTESGSKVATLWNHWHFVTGEALYEIELGYQRYPSRKFYDIARKRLQFMGIDVAEPRWMPARRRGS